MSLETQLVALATQIGTDISTLQAALATAQINLQDLQTQVDNGAQQPSGLTMGDVTTLLQAGFGNPERDLVQVYVTAVMSVLNGGEN